MFGAFPECLPQRQGKGYSNLFLLLLFLIPTKLLASTITATTNPSAGSITFSINCTFNAPSLTVFCLLKENGTIIADFSGNNNGASNTTTYTISRNPGTYSYILETYSAGQSGAGVRETDTRSVTLAAPPTPPTQAPTMDGATQSTTGNYTVSWTAIPSATSYQWRTRTNEGSWSGNTSITCASGDPDGCRSFGVSGKGTGRYGYQAKACNSAGCGGYSAERTVVVARAPGVPASLSASPDPAQARAVFSWGISSGSVTKYNFDYKSSSSSSWINGYDGANQSHTVSPVNPGSYDLRVQGCYTYHGVTACSGWRSSTVTLPSLFLDVPATTTSDSFTVRWAGSGQRPGYIEAYALLQESVSGSWQTLARAEGANTGSFTVSNRLDGTYTFSISNCEVSTNPGGTSTSCTRPLTASIVVNSPPPATPAAPTLPSTSNSGIYTIGWSAVARATRYELQERIASGSWTDVTDLTGTSYGRTVTQSNPYSYRIRACRGADCSAWSAASATVNVAITPGVPSSLSATALHDGDPAVSWQAASGSVTSYSLDKSLNGGGYSDAWEGNALSTTLSNLGAGTWRFRVQACRTTGSYTSCSGWRTSGDSVAAVPASAPGSFSVPANDSDGAFSVSWGSVGNSNTYTLQERTGSGAWTTVQDTSAASRSISGKGSNTYGYRIRACNTLGCSPFSAEKTTDVAIAPGVPTSISGVSNAASEVTVTWGTASGSVSKYDLDESPDNGSTWPNNAYDGMGTSVTLSGRSAGNHKYRVRACRTSGTYTNCSGWRTSASVDVLPPPPAPVVTDYEYDALGRLVEVKKDSVSTSTYFYDLAGNRTKVVENGQGASAEEGGVVSAPLPAKPTNLGYQVSQGGIYNIYWDEVSTAQWYEIKFGESHIETAYDSPYSTGPNSVIPPLYIKACHPGGCSQAAYF